jgi:hypothetical protein
MHERKPVITRKHLAKSGCINNIVLVECKAVMVFAYERRNMWRT